MSGHVNIVVGEIQFRLSVLVKINCFYEGIRVSAQGTNTWVAGSKRILTTSAKTSWVTKTRKIRGVKCLVLITGTASESLNYGGQNATIHAQRSHKRVNLWNGSFFHQISLRHCASARRRIHSCNCVFALLELPKRTIGAIAPPMPVWFARRTRRRRSKTPFPSAFFAPCARPLGSFAKTGQPTCINGCEPEPPQTQRLPIPHQE